MLRNSEEAKKKPYYTKNKKLDFWMPQALHDWFTAYLDKYSYGVSRTEKVRVFLYRLQELEEKGITIANPKADRAANMKDQPLAYDICIRLLNRKSLTPAERTRQCNLCKAGSPVQHQVCQEVKHERREAAR